MTISSTTNKWPYTGDGSTAEYDYTKKIFAETDLEVTVADTDGVETTLTLTTDYTVAGVGAEAGGSITLVNSSQAWLTGGFLTSSYTITLRRVRPLKQETDIRNQGASYKEAIENEFDKQIMIDQQQQEEIDRSIKLPVTTSSGVSAELAPPEVGKALYWETATTLGNTSLTTVDSGTIEDGAIIKAKIGADAVDGTKIEDDAVDSEHIAAGAVDLEHMSANSVDSDQYVDGSIDYVHLAATTVTTILQAVFPVGAIFFSGVSTNPATLFGFGTWTAIEDYVIAGKAASGTFDTLDATLGAETHTLTESEMPAHTHTINLDSTSSGGASGEAVNSSGGGTDATPNTSSTGGGNAHNNIQPTIVKYIWQRTA